jgi:ceramide glucosyltransferase
MSLDPRDIVTTLLLLGSVLGTAYMLLAAHEIAGFVGRPPRRLSLRSPVTVLKPLCGEEAGLGKSLRSFCEEGYEPLQVVFGVRDPSDPAAAVVARLKAELRERDLVLVVDPRVHGKNLKVSNLLNMLGSARHDVLVIADSDIRVAPGYLDAVTAPLQDPSVGLVTCLYIGRSERGFWSQLGAMWVNHGFLPSALVAERLGMQGGCFGATLALRRDTLDAVGGLFPLRDLLADDHALGAAVRATGKAVMLSNHLVDMVVDEPKAAVLVAHELRWLRTIRSIEPWGYVGLALTHPVPLALLALPIAGGSPLSWGVLVLALACRLWLVARVDRALRLPSSAPWRVVFRDCLSFALFLAGFLGSRVAWRGQHFKILPDGALALDGGSQP